MKMDREEEMERSYRRAKKRTEMLRKFYKHLIVYVVINIVISAYKLKYYMGRGDTFEEALFNFDTLIVWGIWGIFLLLQAVRTFNPSIIMGAEWEEKKIQELMNRNKR